jgi:hypothetical protein
MKLVKANAKDGAWLKDLEKEIWPTPPAPPPEKRDSVAPVPPLSEENRKWMQDLEKELWPKSHKNGVVSLKAYRFLTEGELEHLTSILESGSVVVEMICTNMFGGYGIRIYEHEPYPHVGPQFILCVIEDHLPLSDGRKARPGGHHKLDDEDHVPGSGSTRAWEYFSKYTHTKSMKAMCEHYKLNKPEERSYYDY